jgi:hypothetical protein
MIKAHKFDELLFLMTELLEVDTSDNPIISFFKESNLFFMEKCITMEEFSIGADPEFILCEKDNEDEIVLFSSKLLESSSGEDTFAMSSLAIGADYGLLEVRPEYSNSPAELVSNIKALIILFAKRHKNIKIKEVESVPFRHRFARLKEVMEESGQECEIDYGGNRYKDNCVQQVTDNIDATLYKTSFTAYDVPVFTKETDKVLTAGGHIHIGGSCIKVLSIDQLKDLVKELDRVLTPMVEAIETPAAKVRKEYYGIPGEFRFKEYGFEYRVLSCAPFWPKNIETLSEILKEIERIVKTFAFAKEKLKEGR